MSNASTTFSRSTRLVSVTTKKGAGDFDTLIDMQQSTIFTVVTQFCLSRELKMKSFTQPKENQPTYFVDTFDGSRLQFKLLEAVKF